MARRDKQIIQTIGEVLKNELPISEVYYRYPNGKPEGTFAVLTRLAGSDITQVIQHLDVKIDLINTQGKLEPLFDLSDKLPDAIDKWYEQHGMNVMGYPLLNSIDNDEQADTLPTMSFDFQMDYLQ